jgi:hypothetical protein
MTLLSTLIAGLAGLAGIQAPRAPRKDFDRPERPKRRYHRPAPDHMRHAIAVKRAIVEAECAQLDAAVLESCRKAPRTMIDIARDLGVTQRRARSAAARLQASGRARIILMPCFGRAKVLGLEVCDAQ